MTISIRKAEIIVRESMKKKKIMCFGKIKNGRTEIFQIMASHLGLLESPAILNHT